MIKTRIVYEPALDALRRAAAQMGNARPLMRSVAGIMMRAVEDNFEQQGRPKWKDLHPGTKQAREKQGTWPGKILQRTGSLASSIVQHADATTAAVGSNKVYAAIQFLGGRTRPHIIRARNKRALSFGGIVVRSVQHPGSDIPARNALHLTDDDLADIVDEAEQFYSRAIARHAR